jgi:hypothetical protein
MLGKQVNFDGIAWPSARISGSEQVFFASALPAGGMTPMRQRPSFCMMAEGKPRPWTTDVAQAFWRTFTEVADTDDEGQALAFARRYGDPHGKFGSEGAARTGTWWGLGSLLAPFAKAWAPEDSDGISRISSDRALVDGADTWLLGLLAHLAEEVRVVPDHQAADFALRAASLAGYMQLSAMSALKRRVSMRRCRGPVCGSWFEYTRIGGLYCSDRCRTAHHMQTKKG